MRLITADHPAPTKTTPRKRGGKPAQRPQWREIATALEARDEVADTVLAFQMGTIDAKEMTRALDEAAESRSTQHKGGR